MDGYRTKWRQIADDLRAQIAQGKLGPGDRVDGERELATRKGVARMTARRALEALEWEGLLSGGRPRRVTQHRRVTVHVSRTADLTHPGESPTAGADAWVWDMQRAGQEVLQQIQVGIEIAPDDVVRRLGIAFGMTVISRRLTRLANGKPHNLISFWFPQDVAEGTLLAEPASITEGSVAWLEKTYGPLMHEVEVTARMPDPGETSTLRIPQGVPLLVVWRVSRSPERPVVTSKALYPADRTTLRLDL